MPVDPYIFKKGVLLAETYEKVSSCLVPACTAIALLGQRLHTRLTHRPRCAGVAAAQPDGLEDV